MIQASIYRENDEWAEVTNCVFAHQSGILVSNSCVVTPFLNHSGTFWVLIQYKDILQI